MYLTIGIFDKSKTVHYQSWSTRSYLWKWELHLHIISTITMNVCIISNKLLSLCKLWIAQSKFYTNEVILLCISHTIWLIIVQEKVHSLQITSKSRYLCIFSCNNIRIQLDPPNITINSWQVHFLFFVLCK